MAFKRALLRGGSRALKYNVKNSSCFFSAFSRDDDNGSSEEGAYSDSSVGETGDEEMFKVNSETEYEQSGSSSSALISDISGYSPKNKSRVGHSAGGLEDFPGLQESLIDDDLADLPIDFIYENSSTIDLATDTGDIHFSGFIGDLDDYDVKDDGQENVKRKILEEGLVDFQQLANTYKTASPQKSLRNLKKEREYHMGRTRYHLEDVFESTSSIHKLFLDFKHETHYNTLEVEADDKIFACLLRALGRRKGTIPSMFPTCTKCFLTRIMIVPCRLMLEYRPTTALIEIFVGVGLMDNAFDVFENMGRHCDAEEYQVIFSMTKWMNRNHYYLKNNDKHFLRLAHVHLKHSVRMNAVAMYNVLSSLLRMNKLDVAESLIEDYYQKYQTSKMKTGLITWVDQDRYKQPNMEGDPSKHPLSGLNESMGVLKALAHIERFDLMETMGMNIASEVQKRGRYLDLAVVAQILDIFGTVGKFDEAYAWFGKGTRSDKFSESVAFDKNKMLVKNPSTGKKKNVFLPQNSRHIPVFMILTVVLQ